MRLIKLLTLSFLFVLLHFETAETAIFYVGQGVGDADTNSCTTAQTDANGSRKRNIGGANGGISCLVAGNADVLQVRGGTYTESLRDWDGSTPFRSGTSFTNAATIQGFSGETVIIRGQIDLNNQLVPQTAFLIFKDLIVDGTNFADVAVDVGGNHIRFIGVEVRNTPGNGLQVTGNFNEFKNCNVHDNGKTGTPGSGLNDAGYGLYVVGSNNLVEHCDVHHNGGYGIHNYGTNPSNNTYRYNTIHNNSLTAGISTAGILLGSGSGNIAHNNIIYGNFAGIHTSLNYFVYNNTVYGNTHQGIVLGTNSSTSVIKNNIFWGNGPEPEIDDQGLPRDVTISKNVCEAGQVYCDVFGNPLFVDAPGGNFNLQAGSLAIDTGTIIIGFSLYNGAAPDIGAHEAPIFSSAAVGPLTNVRVTLTTNVGPPVMPASACTGFTVTGKTITACTRVGNNAFDLTVSPAFCGGESQTISYSSVTGNVTNALLIGGSKNSEMRTFAAQLIANP